MQTIEQAIQIMIDQAKNDYYNWTTNHGKKDPTDTNKKIIAEYNRGFEVLDNARRKWIKIIEKEDNGSRRVWGFVVKNDCTANGRPFKRGDILKAAGWNAPALNRARGNVFVPGYTVRWTGPLYLN